MKAVEGVSRDWIGTICDAYDQKDNVWRSAKVLKLDKKASQEKVKEDGEFKVFVRFKGFLSNEQWVTKVAPKWTKIDRGKFTGDPSLKLAEPFLPPAIVDPKLHFCQTAVTISDIIPGCESSTISVIMEYISWSFLFTKAINSDSLQLINDDQTALFHKEGFNFEHPIIRNPDAIQYRNPERRMVLLGLRIGPGSIAEWDIRIDKRSRHPDNGMWLGVIDQVEMSHADIKNYKNSWDLWVEKYGHVCTYGRVDCMASEGDQFVTQSGKSIALDSISRFDEGDTVSIRIDYDEKIMKIGLNGKWLGEHNSLRSDYGFFVPYVEFFSLKDQVTVTRATAFYKGKHYQQFDKSKCRDSLKRDLPLPIALGVRTVKSTDIKILSENFGEGHFSTTSIVQIKTDGDKVVMKVPKSTWSAAETQDFESELTALSSLKPHPNVLTFKGAVYYSGKWCFLTEFCDLGSLNNLHKIENLIENFTRIAFEVCSGLKHLHDSNLVHRDMACRNLLMKADHTIVICDFGLARKVGAEEDTKKKDYYSVNNSKELPYLWTAPESLRSGKFDKRSDVYSLGVTFWEIYTKGKTPHHELQEDFSQKKIWKMVSTNDAKLQVPKSVAPEDQKLIKSCLSSLPESRPNMNELFSEMKLRMKKMGFPPWKESVISKKRSSSTSYAMYSGMTTATSSE
eukprot:CAMPEP_0114514148 /NCGR_PEP_ID=MMETSP0109-20121206/15985_1 /TAXON_ID=29199 /ORGANISM="Chlorarachnion reptans, Strain CCCM449" /LENGTH=678 /DNA_ID=CAMNT_0001694141 /DNA_START=1465 /DNA_END=3501 /DNA_ORIENTATION=+